MLGPIAVSISRVLKLARILSNSQLGQVSPLPIALSSHLYSLPIYTLFPSIISSQRLSSHRNLSFFLTPSQGLLNFFHHHNAFHNLRAGYIPSPRYLHWLHDRCFSTCPPRPEHPGKSARRSFILSPNPRRHVHLPRNLAIQRLRDVRMYNFRNVSIPKQSTLSTYETH